MLRSMRPSQDFSIQYPKSMPSDPTSVEVAEDEVVAEDEGVETTEVHSQILQHLRHLPVQPDIGVPDILIFLQVNGQGAPCISNTGKELFSAQSLPPAPGRTSMPQDLLNETSTSLVNQDKNQNLLQFKTLCTITRSIQKYTVFVKMKSQKS